jgi:hypothetical protein
MQCPCGEILSHPENSVPQAIVLRYQEIKGILCTKQRNNGIVSTVSKEYFLDRNLTFFSMLPKQLSPISLLRITMVCGALFSGDLRISPLERILQLCCGAQSFTSGL